MKLRLGSEISCVNTRTSKWRSENRMKFRLGSEISCVNTRNLRLEIRKRNTLSDVKFRFENGDRDAG
jgi:hypothetical protein